MAKARTQQQKVTDAVLSAILNTVSFCNSVHVFGCMSLIIDGRDTDSLTLKLNATLEHADNNKLHNKQIEDSVNVLRSTCRKRSKSFDFANSQSRNDSETQLSAFRRSASASNDLDLQIFKSKDNTECHSSNNLFQPISPNRLSDEYGNKPEVGAVSSSVTVVVPPKKVLPLKTDSGKECDRLIRGTTDPKQRQVLERALKEFLKLKYQQKKSGKTPPPEGKTSCNGSSPLPPELVKLVTLQARVMGVPMPLDILASPQKSCDTSSVCLSEIFKEVNLSTPTVISQFVLNKNMSHDETEKQEKDSSQDAGITKQKRLSFSGKDDKYHLEQGAFAKAMQVKLDKMKTNLGKEISPTIEDKAKRKSLFRTGSEEKRKAFVKQMLSKCEITSRKRSGSELSRVSRSDEKPCSPAKVSKVDENSNSKRETCGLVLTPPEDLNIVASNEGIFANLLGSKTAEPKEVKRMQRKEKECFTFKPIVSGACLKNDISLNVSIPNKVKPKSSSCEPVFVANSDQKRENTASEISKSSPCIRKHVTQNVHASNITKIENTDQNNLSVSTVTSIPKEAMASSPHPFLSQESLVSLNDTESDQETESPTKSHNGALPFADIDSIPDLPCFLKRTHSIFANETQSAVQNGSIHQNEDSNGSCVSTAESVGFEVPHFEGQSETRNFTSEHVIGVTNSDNSSALCRTNHRRRKSQPKKSFPKPDIRFKRSPFNPKSTVLGTFLLNSTSSQPVNFKKTSQEILVNQTLNAESDKRCDRKGHESGVNNAITSAKMCSNDRNVKTSIRLPKCADLPLIPVRIKVKAGFSNRSSAMETDGSDKMRIRALDKAELENQNSLDSQKSKMIEQCKTEFKLGYNDFEITSTPAFGKVSLPANCLAPNEISPPSTISYPVIDSCEAKENLLTESTERVSSNHQSSCAENPLATILQKPVNNNVDNSNNKSQISTFHDASKIIKPKTPHHHLLVRPVFSSPSLSNYKVSPKNTVSNNTHLPSSKTGLLCNGASKDLRTQSQMIKGHARATEMLKIGCPEKAILSQHQPRLTTQEFSQPKPVEFNVELIEDKIDSKSCAKTCDDSGDPCFRHTRKHLAKDPWPKGPSLLSLPVNTDKENDDFVKFVMSPPNVKSSKAQSKSGSDNKRACNGSKRPRRQCRKGSKVGLSDSWTVPTEYQRNPNGSGRCGKAKKAPNVLSDNAGFKMKKYWLDMYGPGSPLVHRSDNLKCKK